MTGKQTKTQTTDKTMAKKIRNQKHSELFREYEEQKRKLNSCVERMNQISSEFRQCKKQRRECTKRCYYLKRMINQSQRTYAEQNQRIVCFDLETGGLNPPTTLNNF